MTKEEYQNDPRFKAFIAFKDQLETESDRGCALASAAFLDNELEALLRKRLVQTNKGCLNDALDYRGAMGTFSSRIDMAYLVGIIPASARNDLHLIRKTRNKFGHFLEINSFETEEIAGWCKMLHWSFREPEVTPRAHFNNAVTMLLAFLQYLTVVTIDEETYMPYPTQADKLAIRQRANAETDQQIIKDQEMEVAKLNEDMRLLADPATPKAERDRIMTELHAEFFGG